MANIDRSKITDFDRASLGNGNGGQIGALDRGKLDKARDANFNPTATDRDAARAKIADKAASGKDVSTLPAAKGNGASRDYATGPSTKIATKPANSAAATKAVGAKPKAAAAKPKSPKVSKPSSGAKPATARKPSKNDPAFLPQGGSRSGAASARGHASKKGR